MAPLNTGVVYFHKTKAFANHAGINVVWNFFQSLTMYDRFVYREDIMNQAEAEATIHELTHSVQPTQTLIRTRTPNLLFIILESFTAKTLLR